jgi:uncharacterized 2Fe-2S/4Fe-4S cluster protein (DUF4445 family)
MEHNASSIVHRPSFIVRFEPWGVTVECAADQSLLDAARQAEIPVGAVCSGRGTCGKCQVRILSVPAPEPTQAERTTVAAGALEQGFRLACMHKADRDLTVEILPIISHGKGEAPPLERTFELASAVRRQTVTLQPPSLDRPIADGDNLLAALAEAGHSEVREIDYRTAQALPAVLRSAAYEVGRVDNPSHQPNSGAANWRLSVSLRAAEVIGVRPAAHAAPPLGLAVDLGTTNIATYLYNLNDGSLLGVFGAANPLASYGADILSRLIYAGREPENGARLQRTLVKTLNLLIQHAAKTSGFAPADVEEMTVVGNSGMHHLFLNFPPHHLIRAPYVPALRRGIAVKARELGIAITPGGYVYAPPLIGGFVGSDLLAVALATRLDRKPGVRLALDIGTNTELLLSVDGKLFSCSTASGPALEGAALRYGSVAAAGVVDRVWLNPTAGTFGYRTIRGKPAVGICGSGIVEALACMAQAGIFNTSGRVQAGKPGVIAAADGDHRFVLVPRHATGLGEDLTISQHDVRAIQLAKGAIRGGMATLLAEHGLAEDDLDELLVAGAFGNHIGVEAAQAIGLYPPIPRERIRQIGNAAGTGAGLMLLSTAERRDAEELSEQINYLELARHKRFTRLFAEGQRFPVTARP